MLDLSQLSPQQKYLLAISGGRDSVALLYLLLEHSFQDLHLVHLNHQLRGEDSDADEQFIRDLAAQHDLPLTLAQAPVANLAEQNKESLETAARNARHQLFAETAQATQCNRILLAHHADDQAETVLFNLLRGSAGLRGIAPTSQLSIHGKELLLIRPLLLTRREEINEYLSNKKISYREDLSNSDPAFTRNRMRNEALPLLTEIMERDIVPPLIRATETTRQDRKVIAELLEHLELLDPQGRLFLPKIRLLSPALQRECLANYLRKHQVSRISQKLLDDACTLIPAEGPARLNLPGNHFLHRKESRIFFS